VKKDPALVRACDEPVIAGDVSKFQVCSGWAAEIELFQTVHDMLDWEAPIPLWLRTGDSAKWRRVRCA
jgi:hypothetical protein